MRLALAGDTMLGRKVAERLATAPDAVLFAPEVAELTRSADLFVLNLECCVSERGTPWPDPGKPFFFRAPPRAIDALQAIGVDCVTVANNHALDFGEDALLDTLGFLDRAGIAHAGAGGDVEAARAPAVVEAGDARLAVVGLTDHPADFAAGPSRAGTAFADLASAVPSWVLHAVGRARAHGDAVLVSPHWGPNMVAQPVGHVRRAAAALVESGATLVAGHSAHVVHGVAGPVLFDLGDFIDDYAVDRELRNDLGLLFLVELDARGPRRLEAVPLRLDFCFTGLASGPDRAWICRRFRAACAALGTEAREEGGRVVVDW